MSYSVNLHIPSCCAEKLDLLAEVEECTPSEMLVRLFMVGMFAYGGLRATRLPAGMQTSCDWTTEHLRTLMEERWA